MFVAGDIGKAQPAPGPSAFPPTPYNSHRSRNMKKLKRKERGRLGPKS